MMTKGTAEIEAKSKRAGADAYLAKPFSFDDLIATLTRIHPTYAQPDSPNEVRTR